MITNERQYRITKAAVGRFEDALTHGHTHEVPMHPRLRQAMQESLESQIAELREDVAEYEALRSGRVTVLELDSLAAIPDALIRARAVAGLTQKELAMRLGMKEQQVQRYEATRYVGVSLARMQAVADALGVTIHERMTLPTHDEVTSSQ